MKKLFAIGLLGLVNLAYALDASEQRYVDMISQGSLTSVKQASQDIFNTGEDNPAVLDLLAEVLLQKYATATSSDIDTLSWAAKALGKSGNSRYHDALAEVADKTSDKKLRKYAEKALDEVGTATGTQYQRGNASLKGTSSSRTPNDKEHSSQQHRAGKSQSLDAVTKGMSQDQAYALVGEPTSSTGHVTGKAWIPFNFKGADTARLYALYKGKGRIIFTNRSHYDHTWQVHEVQIDPNESGYP